MKALMTATLTLLLAGLVHADDDVIGIYFDKDASQVELKTEVVQQQVAAYLIAVSTSAQDAIAGWEASLRVESDGLMAQSWSYAGSDLDADADDYQIELAAGAALPWSQAVILATWSGMVLGTQDRVAFFVGAREGSSALPDAPGYVVESAQAEVHELHVAGDAASGLVALINADEGESVAVPSTTLSRLKTLYR